MELTKSISTKTPLVALHDENEEQNPLSRMRVACPHRSTVLSEELTLNDKTNANANEEQKCHTAAGRKHKPDAYGYVCCSDPNIFFNAEHNCLCKDTCMKHLQCQVNMQKQILHF